MIQKDIWFTKVIHLSFSFRCHPSHHRN